MDCLPLLLFLLTVSVSALSPGKLSPPLPGQAQEESFLCHFNLLVLVNYCSCSSSCSLPQFTSQLAGGSQATPSPMHGEPSDLGLCECCPGSLCGSPNAVVACQARRCGIIVSPFHQGEIGTVQGCLRGFAVSLPLFFFHGALGEFSNSLSYL